MYIGRKRIAYWTAVFVLVLGHMSDGGACGRAGSGHRTRLSARRHRERLSELRIEENDRIWGRIESEDEQEEEEEGLDASQVQFRRMNHVSVQAPCPWNLEILSASPLDLAGNRGNRRFSYPSSSGRGVRVYVVDTGIDITHPQFQGRAEWGTTILPSPDADIPDRDEHGHGTHVAGIIGSSIYGVAKEAHLVAVKIFRNDTGPLRHLYQGLSWAVNNASHYVDRIPCIIHSSITSRKSRSLHALFKRAEALGITIVTAAGNEEMDACQLSSAGDATIITVGAFCNNLEMATFSNTGPCVDILAPGCSIPSLSPFHHHRATLKNGTSMAAPHVTGVAALILSASQRRMNVSELKDTIKRLAIPRIPKNRRSETPQLFLNMLRLIQ